jgi:hypothetical protein
MFLKQERKIKMAIVNPWANPIKLTLKYHFFSEFIPGKFDKLVLNFRKFVADYITKNVIDICKLDSEDIEYCNKINFNAIEIASDIEKAINYNANEFRKDRFEYLLGENNMTKTSFTHSHDLIYMYKAPGIVFEVRVPQPDKHEFDMSITILDGYDNSKSNTTQNAKDSETKANESEVDKPKEEKSRLDANAEKAIISIDLNYTQYKNTLRSLGGNITKEDVEILEALAKTIRTASYSIARPTTPENALENLMTKGIIKPEFKMAYNSMFDNLIKDPLRYFFAKYEGAKFVEHKETVLTLDFQFERKLYSMYFEYTNLTKLEDREKLATLFKEALAELYQIREHFLRDLLGATGDLITYLKLVEDNEIDNDNLSPLFYDYVYNKIVAFKTLASTYEADVFVNNPTVAKCKEMESSIDEITTKIQEWLTKSKTNIAKLFYTKLV